MRRWSVLGLFVILILLLVASTAALAETPLIIGEHRRDRVLETPHPYPSGVASSSRPVWSDHYYFPDARYLVFEFQRFDLAPGDRLEIRDPKGRQVHVYQGKGFKNKGGDFISKMILGPEAIIDLYSSQSNRGHYGYRIERITRGYSTLELTELYPQYEAIEAICGGDDKEDAVCYETSFPEVYDKGRAVARIVMDGAALCTAWLVSCDNHVLTNNHCTWDDSDFDTQGELDRMEFQFQYEDPSCGGSGAVVEYSFMGGTWLENNHNLDYTLIQAPAGENPAATYGWLLVDDRLVDIDETIYIVGHPSGRPKEISLYSDAASDQDNPDGFCEVYTQDEPACLGGGVPEIGYMCDTEGGNSGSPVLSRDTHKVVALHHCANCPNRGVRIQNVWAANQAGSNPLPACSLFADLGTVELDREAYTCLDTVSIEVTDDSIRGTGTHNVTLWSATEPTPEVVTLTETGVDTGRFQGTIDTSTLAPAGADGLLSVADGGTITVQYIDADDGQGGINIPREDMAGVDCQGPVISDVQAVNVLGSTADISWNTDEEADSTVDYSLSPPSWSTASDSALVTAHQVNLTGLSECMTYGYQVASADALGQSSSNDNGGQYYFFTTGVNVQPVFASTDTPLAVVDNQSTSSAVQVTDDETVFDVNVLVNISHTFTGDLDIYLMGPNGVEIELSTDNGGTGDDYQDTTFDDEAPTGVTAGAAPFTGAFFPEQPLFTFDGLSSLGTWTLRIHDDSGGDTGTLESWTLQLSYPLRACGPQASYSSHGLVADACTTGGPGDSDGRWDPGESVDFGVTVINDGRDPLTGITATVVPLTPGVVLAVDTASYSDLSPGASGASLGTDFTAQLPTTVQCGEAVDFRIDITANEGSWSNTFQQAAGLVVSGGGTALDEDFEGSGIPANWTVVDGGTSTDSWFTDNVDDPTDCNNTDANAPIFGNWAAVDSDCAGGVDMDEALITPVLDLSTTLTVTLEFDHFFNRFETESAELDIRSSLTGGIWVNINAWADDTANAQHESFDITNEAAGAADVEIRWHYYAANFEWYWFVDNVLVTFTSIPGCETAACLSSGAPGEQVAYWPDLVDFTWKEDFAATNGYTVYRGAQADLPGLLDGSVESCVRFTGVDGSDNLVDLSADDPSGVAGGFYWYVVTGWNGIGEGSAGNATAGPRVVNSSGPCP